MLVFELMAGDDLRQDQFASQPEASGGGQAGVI